MAEVSTAEGRCIMECGVDKGFQDMEYEDCVAIEPWSKVFIHGLVGEEEVGSSGFALISFLL